MNTEFTDNQEQLRESVRRFLAEQAPLTFVRELWDEPRGTSDAVWKGLAELGLIGLLAPEAAGGAGGEMRDMGVVLQELGRVAHPGPFLTSAVGAISAASALGAEDLLPVLADGTRIGTLAVAEPGAAATSWASPSVRVEGGRLYGAKSWVAHGATADWLFVTAGDGVHLVEAGAPGLSTAAVETVDGTRRFASVDFDGTPSRRLGDLAALEGVIDRLLVAGAIDALGAAEVCLELAVDYAKQRTQFGQPVGAFQAVSHLCADMLQSLELTRSGVHYALWAADCAQPEERRRSAIMARAQSALALPPVAASAIQVFGGVGYTWEYDVHLYYKRLLTHEVEFGAADEWLEELAKRVL